ncbi:hypothetical protein F3D3_3308 [Fusibacter sp. 3D3]|nr:hypothetical protein F3D3_3308 [Fusibacter sp. 3D3]
MSLKDATKLIKMLMKVCATRQFDEKDSIEISFVCENFD